MSRATPRRSAAVLFRAAATAIVASSIFTIAACGDQEENTQIPATNPATDAGQATTAPTAPSVRGSDLPVDTTLDLAGSRETSCPYLNGGWVQEATGQKLTGVSLDPRFDLPGCGFWSFEEDPQVQVSVRTMRSNSEAVAVEDSAAPVDSTLKALKPDGWSGGRGSDDENGAVYAVWKDEVAAVGTTAQPQSVKAQQRPSALPRRSTPLPRTRKATQERPASPAFPHHADRIEPPPRRGCPSVCHGGLYLTSCPSIAFFLATAVF